MLGFSYTAAQVPALAAERLGTLVRWRNLSDLVLAQEDLQCDWFMTARRCVFHNGNPAAFL
jgi:hypothetical protein